MATSDSDVSIEENLNSFKSSNNTLQFITWILSDLQSDYRNLADSLTLGNWHKVNIGQVKNLLDLKQTIESLQFQTSDEIGQTNKWGEFLNVQSVRHSLYQHLSSTVNELISKKQTELDQLESMNLTKINRYC